MIDGHGQPVPTTQLVIQGEVAAIGGESGLAVPPFELNDTKEISNDRPRARQRALISLSDKTGLDRLGRHWPSMASSWSRPAGRLRSCAAWDGGARHFGPRTGFPEMMNGRVKTLHPKVHGGLLGVRGNAEHAAAMEQHGIAPIDLVVVNLYPFEATVARGAERDEIIENIDIGGPSMVRSAAKNHAHVAIVTDPADYDELLDELDANDGATSYNSASGWRPRPIRSPRLMIR